MAFDFSGHVLRGARVAPVNQITTAEATTGVERDIRPVPAAYDLSAAAPDFVDAAADQYRTAILTAPGTSTTEYLLWAQNTSQLGLVDDITWWSNLGAGSIPKGTLQITDASPVELSPGDLPPAGYGFFYDGTNKVVVTDNGNRSLARILYIVVARGDVDTYDDDGWSDEDDPSLGRDGSPPYQVLTIGADDQDADAGLVTLSSTQLTALNGGLSRDRGDTIVEVIYTVASARFWWTRNDRHENRFGWNGQTQRWEPWKGTATKNLGRLLFDMTYQLDPKIKSYAVGSYLPGDALQVDDYAMIRLGSLPGSTSLPVGPDATGVSAWKGVRVKPDTEVENGYEFTKDPLVSAVVGFTNVILEFNPAFVREQAGKIIWYSYETFDENADGLVGALRGADTTPLYLAPIPGPTDYPFIRLGSRRHLTPTLVANDAALGAVGTGEVAISLSTGRLALAQVDVDKANPTKAGFNKHFLGENVYYDGVALNSTPQPTRQPVALVGSDGLATTVDGSNALYIPDASYLPTEFVIADAYRGLGKSGVLDAPDGTGANPDQVGVAASVRPGGDTVAATTTGRVRKVLSDVGDSFLFS